MDDTYSFIKPLNDSNVVFILGDSPTVTFNENVTVYSYPKAVYVELTPTMQQDNIQEQKQTQTQTQSNMQTKQKNIFTKMFNKLSNFRI